MSGSLSTVLSVAARNFGRKTALVCDDHHYSFNDLDQASSKLASALRKKGIPPGSTVTLLGENSADWVIAYFAIAKSRCIVNPLNSMLTPFEVSYAAANCRSALIFASADKAASLLANNDTVALSAPIMVLGDERVGKLDTTAELISGTRIPMPPGDEVANLPAAICYSSGTTGFPKGAVLSHRAILLNARFTATAHMRVADDIVVSALPLPHVYGNVVLVSSLIQGATLVLHRRFETETFLASIQRYRATIIDAVPTMYMYMLAHADRAKLNPGSLRRLTVGGQSMSRAKLAETAEAFGCPVLELWGMTEIAGLGTTQLLLGPNVAGSVGPALPYNQVRIVDLADHERVLAVGETGELLIRGPTVMDGYFDNPEATSAAILQGGWLRTGDAAAVDPNGELFIVDRAKDVILTGGFNIYPAEVERVIASFPGIAMAAVGGKPCPIRGEVPKAYVVARSDVALSLAALEQHCREHLAAYKVPREFQLVADLPTTSSGKIMRRELSSLEQNAQKTGERNT